MTDLYRPDSLRLVETGDGSRTLFDPERDVHYSSTHGAADESRHVFVEGTELLEAEPPHRVLELGFGAGINFVQSVRALDERSGRLVYHTVDYAPVPASDADFHGDQAGGLVVEALRRAETGAPQTITVGDDSLDAELHLHVTRWRDLELSFPAVDSVYFDPFGPKSEPESWDRECFEVAREAMHEEAILGTYSAASDVKRAMFRAGLAVASAPGPGPKREITFAARRAERLRDRDLLDRNDYVDE